MAITKAKLIADGIITVNNLHESHGITTTHIGEGNKLFYTDTRVSNYLSANNYITTSDVPNLETVTSLSISANILSYTNEAGITTNIDLSTYLDDTNLARLVSGTLDGLTGIATFTRDDSSTFTIDFSAFLADANDYVSSGSFNTSTGVLTLTRLGGGTVTVDLDGKYAEASHTHLWSHITDRPTALSVFTNDLGNYGGFVEVESDPTVPSHVKSITTTNISNWNTAYGWGNHAGLYSLLGHTHDYLPIGGKAADSELLDGINSTSFLRYTGWVSYPGQDANTQDQMKSDFTYSNNAPFTGELIRFSAGGYSLQLNASYQSSDGLAFRTYNADSAQTWNPWKTIIHSGNIGSQSVNYANSAGTATDSSKLPLTGGTLSGALILGSTASAGSSAILNTNGFIRVAEHVIIHNPSNLAMAQGISWDSSTNGLYTYNESSTGTLRATGSMRAPIFYDSDNTGYYVDPSSSSQSAYFRGPITQISQANSSWPYLFTTSAVGDNNHSGFWVSNVGYPDMRLRREDGTVRALISSWERSYTSFGLTDSTDMRAPIFYDSNDTNYYIDANGNSRIFRLNLSENQPNATNNAGGRVRISSFTNGASEMNNDSYNIVLGPYSTRSGAGYYAGIAINGLMNYGGGTGYDTAPHIWIGAQYRDTPGSERSDFVIGVKSGTGVSGTGTDIPQERFRVDYAGIATATGSFRAPVFYDSDNTGYYLDPHATSNLNTVQVSTIRNNGSVADDDAFGIYWTDNADSGYGIYRESGGWSHPYPDLRIAFHTGIKLGANSSYNGIRFYDDYAMATQVMSVNNGSDPLGAGHVYVNNTLQAGEGLRAPIFYDSNDTNYYINPNNTSNLAGLTVGSQITGSVSGYARYAKRISEPERINFTVGGNSSTFYPISIYTGAGATGSQYAEFVIERGGYDDPGYSGIGFSTFNARFTYKPSGWGYGAVYFNLEQLTQTATCLADYVDYYQASEAIIWLRGGTTYWIYSIVGGITMNFSNPDGTSYSPTYNTFSPTTSINTKASYAKYFHSSSYTDGTLRSGTDVQAPIFYDINDTGYYIDPNSTGTCFRGNGGVYVNGDVTAYYSDMRLKTKIADIKNPIEKVKSLSGFIYEPNEIAQSYGYKKEQKVGVSAQEVQAVLPEAVKDAPIGNGYLTVQYDKLVPLLIEAIKEQQKQIEELKAIVNGITK